MKNFRYIIVDDEIAEAKGEIASIPQGFIEVKLNMGADKVHYKIENGHLTEAIGEGIHEETARRRIEEFLSTFNVTRV